jgi:CRP/FNR family cyclic AMP-dependent transcriptional regulator
MMPSRTHETRKRKGPSMSEIQSDEALYALLARAGESRRLGAGDVVFEKGTHGESMYILASGTVALTDGGRTLDTIHAPSLFGELALIESQPRALTATVTGDADLVEISARMFWVLVHETPYFAHLVMRVMADRLRRASGT